METWISFRPFIAKFSTSIRRTVIDNYYIKVCIGLISNTLEAMLQVLFHIINRHDNAD